MIEFNKLSLEFATIWLILLLSFNEWDFKRILRQNINHMCSVTFFNNSSVSYIPLFNIFTVLLNTVSFETVIS